MALGEQKDQPLPDVTYADRSSGLQQQAKAAERRSEAWRQWGDVRRAARRGPTAPLASSAAI